MNTLARTGKMFCNWSFNCLQAFFVFLWFDSLRPINNLSVKKGWVFLGWTSAKLGLMFLLKDTTQWRRWGSNPRPFGLESTTLPLSHCAPCLHAGVVFCAGNCTHSVLHYQAWVLCHPDQVWHKSALTWLQPLFTLFSLFFVLKIAKYAKSYPDFPRRARFQ